MVENNFGMEIISLTQELFNIQCGALTGSPLKKLNLTNLEGNTWRLSKLIKTIGQSLIRIMEIT